MKKVLLTLSLVLVTTAFVIISCSKEETSGTKERPSDNLKALKVYSDILNFKEKVSFYKRSQFYKAGEKMSIDSILWYFNATLNYDHSLVDDPYKNFFSTSGYSQLPVDQNNMVDINEAMEAYLEIEGNIQDVYAAAPFSEKAVKFTFVSLESQENGEITLNSRITIGERGTEGSQPFGQDDDWMYGDDLGDCYGNYFMERDGADEIRDVVESRRHLFINDVGYVVFYINPIRIYLDKEDIDNNPLLDLTNGQGYDNDRDYIIFYAHDNHCPQGTTLEDFECIQDGDMNFYLFQMEDLVYDLIPSEPDYWPDAEDLTFVEFDTIKGTKLDDYSLWGKKYLIHMPEIIFAERIVIEE